VGGVFFFFFFFFYFNKKIYLLQINSQGTASKLLSVKENLE